MEAIGVDSAVLGVAGAPQSWPSRQIFTGTWILSKTASSYFLPLKINKKQIGKITKLELDLEDYNAKVDIVINENIKIPDDSSAKITSSSLLGGNFLNIIPGSSEKNLEPRDVIYDTTDPVSFTDMLGKVIFSGNKK